jgi:Glycosyl hydrolases family 18
MRPSLRHMLASVIPARSVTVTGRSSSGRPCARSTTRRNWEEIPRRAALFALAVVGAVAFLVPGTAAAAVSANYTNVVFSDGFDSGNLSAWTGFTGNGSASVTPAAAYSGADGLQLSNTKNEYGAEVKQLSSPLTNSSTSFWVRVNSAASGYSGTDLETIAEARDDASSSVLWQLVYDSSRQGLWFIPAEAQSEQEVFTGAGTVPLGQWNQVQVLYDAASNGGAEVLINGRTQPTWSLTGNYTRSDNLQRLQLWNDAATGTDFDSVVVATPGSTTAAAPPAPSNTAVPVVSGTAQEGDTLTTSNGSWNGSPTSYSYKWEDCNSSGASCSAISGATSSTYVLAASDVGDTVRAVVTATNAGGSTPATSAQTAVVTAASSGSSGFQSVVFWLAWDGGTLSSLPWSAVTQVDMFSLASCVSSGDPEPDCSGPTSVDTEFNGVNNADVSGFVSTVHQNGALAIITIGGSTNPNWYYPCNGSNAATFAQNLVNYMQSNGFDGVDLDIEQDPTTGSPAFTSADLQACVEDVYNDAKAIKTQAGKTPLVTADVDPTTDYDIGQIEEPYIDQFNAMSYGATGSTLASQIHALETQSDIPASKITEGVDIDDDPSTRSDCGSNASWAASNGLAGAMLWYGQADAASPAWECLDAVGPYVG